MQEFPGWGKFPTWEDIHERTIDTGKAKAIPIPEGATNGDMIKAVFPNARDWEVKAPNMVSGHYIDLDKCGTIKVFSLDWWNAQYKRGDK